MIIDELIIDNFGKLNNKKIKLESGINIIYGENESGKSTMVAFIKAMLFGLNKTRARNIANDEYSMYEPWSNRSFYEGKLRIKTGGTTYRIERVFQKNEKAFHVIDEEAGKEIYPDTATYKKIIQELTEETFSNTLLVTQSKYGIGQGLSGEIKNYVSNLNGSKTMDIDVQRAISELKKERKVFEKKIMALEIARLEDELQRYGDVDNDIINLQNKLSELNKVALEYGIKEETVGIIKKAEPPKEEPPKEVPEISEDIKLWVIVLFIWVLSIILMLFTDVGVGLITGIITSFSFMMYIRMSKNYKLAKEEEEKARKAKEEEERKAKEKTYTEAEVEEKRRELQKNRDKIHWTIDSLYEKRIKYIEDKEKYEALKQKEAEYKEEIRAINVAINTINELSCDIQADFGSDINELASEYIRYFTNGKYQNISVDLEMNVFLNEKEKLIQIEQLSYATARQVYLAVRLAAGRVLFNEEKMPIILDESFAMYDDVRLFNTLKGLMKVSSSQIIIFTCVKREMQLLDEMNVEYNLIDISQKFDITRGNICGGND